MLIGAALTGAQQLKTESGWLAIDASGVSVERVDDAGS